MTSVEGSSKRTGISRRGLIKASAATAVAYQPASSAIAAAPSGRRLAARSRQATTVTFSATGDANVEQPVFRDLIDMFNQSQSEVFVEYQPFPEGGFEKATAMLQAGEVPDIMRIDDDQVYLIASAGKAHDLTAYFAALTPGDYHAYLFHELAVQDRLFAIPMCDSVWSWMYNKALFQEAGVTAPTSWADAWEWDQALQYFGQIAKRSGDFTEVYAGQIGHGEELPYQAGVGHYNHDMTRANFNHQRVVDMLSTIASLQYEQGIGLPPGGGEPLDLFNAGQLGFINGVQSNTPSLSPDIDWDFMPQAKQPSYTMSAQFSRAFILPVDGPAKNPDAAWAFFQWYLTSPDAQRRALEGSWGIPPLKSLATAEELGQTGWGAGRNVNVLIEGLDYAYPRLSTPFTDAMATHWKGGAEWERVMLGERPAADFCAAVADLVQQTMNEAISAGWQYVPPPNSEMPSSWTRWYYQGDVRDDDPRVQAGLAKDDPAVQSGAGPAATPTNG